MRLPRPLASLATLLLALPATARAQEIKVSWDPAQIKDSKSALLVLFLYKEGSTGPVNALPIDAPFFQAPQPIFSLPLSDLPTAPTGQVTLPLTTQGFLGAGNGWGPLSALPSGKYKFQAALITNREAGDWRLSPHNAHSNPVAADLTPTTSIGLRVTRPTAARAWPQDAKLAEEFTLRSELLSNFHGRDVFLRAGVRPPTAPLKPNHKYAAVYDIPGFGGDHYAALFISRRNLSPAGAKLAASTYHITLDPSSPNGHTLFCDSANNGPWATALITEFLPALEARYPLLKNPNARLLRGHSSGGWSTLWLATNNPETFGATWSSSPDPVDFGRFQQTDIYTAANLYTDPTTGKDIPSKRNRSGEVTMTVKDENLVEHALGPDLTSAQQWTSWQACWGSRQKDGSITPLYNPLTGQIDREEANHYRHYDLTHQLAADPAKLLRVYQNNIRLLVGTQDDYYLNEAVQLLQNKLNELSPTPQGEGYIRFVPNADHSSIFGTPEMFNIPEEMLTHLKAKALEALPLIPPTQPLIYNPGLAWGYATRVTFTIRVPATAKRTQPSTLHPLQPIPHAGAERREAGAAPDCVSRIKTFNFKWV